MAKIMPLFSILFYILCLGNCGTPLTLNFIGEFMSLMEFLKVLHIMGYLLAYQQYSPPVILFICFEKYLLEDLIQANL